jgi:hypothetical protein
VRAGHAADVRHHDLWRWMRFIEEGLHADGPVRAAWIVEGSEGGRAMWA